MSLDEGFKEEEFRKLAKELLPEWLPWGLETHKSQNSWGCPGLGGTIQRSKEEGFPEYEFWVQSQNKRGMGTVVPLTYGLEAIRATAIGLLIFCEAEEWRKENEST